MKAILKTAAVSAAGALRPGMLVDSEDKNCPLTINDIKRYVAQGLAIEQTEQATEQAALPAAETATAVSGGVSKPTPKRAPRKKSTKTTTKKEG